MKRKNINIRKDLLYVSMCCMVTYSLSAQENITVNKGGLYIKPNTVIATYFDFSNKGTGNVINDGEFYFYGDYNNEGLFSFTTNQRTGYVVFEGSNKTIQSISGDSPSMFYDVLFNKAGGAYSFDLTNDISSQGKVNLLNGVVLMNKEQGGAFIFLKGATHINTSDKSHVDGEVSKQGNDNFRYPIGNGGYYRYAQISAPAAEADHYTGEYFLKNSNPLYPHTNKAPGIELIDTQEYWAVEQKENTQGSVLLTLSWDERTTPSALLANEAKDLRIVRWDASQNLWVNEGGIINRADKTVTTPAVVNGFGIFTLAKLTPDMDTPTEIVIYNGVTPNGDGSNDYFIIDNIQRYPNNSVRIYNRWGREIFKTTNYDSNGNVFRGYSENSANFKDGEKLPTGTYYYILEYEYTDAETPRMIKKSGFLHLEND
ncbi:gliding motility-associated C-terminal domain-containing protein [Myroides ceti]|uniref:Gliding motility-associated C-terminal domain-containing protein n=1 Tax=Paenimyroides ceti TaxID=395087 RepID=A0ABT8CTJ2_9FLAO|nr:gliding motility-associated C-terminal domain-containing protein [Paenimyroides ceti]MDN3707550.1 gliding motility-associated C-terminal domain-containing protein [Paenimyroides ceti]